MFFGLHRRLLPGVTTSAIDMVSHFERNTTSSKMNNAIATVCLSGPLNEKLEAIAAAASSRRDLLSNDLLSYNGTQPTSGA